MDDSFSDLEAELKALCLRAPSRQVQDRLEEDLGVPSKLTKLAPARYESATNLNTWKWLGWRTAGAAAALLAAATVGLWRFASPAPTDLPATPLTRPDHVAATSTANRPLVPARADRYHPSSASNVLYDLTDEGAVDVGDELPARRLRYRYLDTYTWKDPRGHASLKWSVPRDEVRIIPARLN